MNSKSCVGCKYLLREDEGYSNYTVMDTKIDCLLKKNSNLPAYASYDWTAYYLNSYFKDPQPDNWNFTNNSRCESFSEGTAPNIDVDRELVDWKTPWKESCVVYSDDPEVKEALKNYYANSNE